MNTGGDRAIELPLAGPAAIIRSVETITVHKLDHTGVERMAYSGEVVRRTPGAVVVRARWQLEPMDLGFITLELDDIWTEYYYADRWYNIFEIRDQESRLKGWYCNVTRPARIEQDAIYWEDLALDLWVAPDGMQQVLDEDEFNELAISRTERRAALQALAHLQTIVRRRLSPMALSAEADLPAQDEV